MDRHDVRNNEKVIEINKIHSRLIVQTKASYVRGVHPAILNEKPYSTLKIMDICQMKLDIGELSTQDL